METAAERLVRSRNADDIWKRIINDMLEEQARADGRSEQPAAAPVAPSHRVVKTALQATGVELVATAPNQTSH